MFPFPHFVKQSDAAPSARQPPVRPSGIEMTADFRQRRSLVHRST
jgi:hypothetical protein